MPTDGIPGVCTTVHSWFHPKPTESSAVCALGRTCIHVYIEKWRGAITFGVRLGSKPACIFMTDCRSLPHACVVVLWRACVLHAGMSRRPSTTESTPQPVTALSCPPRMRAAHAVDPFERGGGAPISAFYRLLSIYADVRSASMTSLLLLYCTDVSQAYTSDPEQSMLWAAYDAKAAVRWVRKNAAQLRVGE